MLYGAVPAFGIAADGYVLVRSFFVGLWNEGESGRSVIRFDAGCAVIAAALAARKLGGKSAPAAMPAECADVGGGEE